MAVSGVLLNSLLMGRDGVCVCDKNEIAAWSVLVWTVWWNSVRPACCVVHLMPWHGRAFEHGID